MSVAAVAEPICVVGIEPDRLVVVLKGAVVLAFGKRGVAAVEERQCVGRLNPDRFIAIRKGLVAFLFSVPLGATIVEKGGEQMAAISTGINRTRTRGYCFVARCLSAGIAIVCRGGCRRQPNGRHEHQSRQRAPQN
jgi:ribose/xylose/arabinose/galactoside ABC-type transport system permease subunit